MTVTIQGTPLQAAQPITHPDGTMAPHFRDWIYRVSIAVGDSSLVSVWGNVSGTLSDQTDVQAAIDAAAGDAAWGGITGTLSAQTDLQAALTSLDAGDTTTGTFADARISESSVTQHEAALTITESQVSDLDKYTQAQVDALLVYYPPSYRDEATDPYTLVLADANKVLRFTTADAAVTIPTNASVAFPLETEISIRQAGTGTLVLTTTSLTINGTVPSWAQHVEVKFRKVGTDTWDVV